MIGKNIEDIWVNDHFHLEKGKVTKKRIKKVVQTSKKDNLWKNGETEFAKSKPGRGRITRKNNFKEINVFYHSIFRRITGVRNEKIKTENFSKVLDLLNFLFNKYGERFKSLIVTGTGITGKSKILLNGADIRFLNGLSSKFEQKNSIHFLPSISGASRDVESTIENILKKERAEISWIMRGFGTMIQEIVEMVKSEIGEDGENAINKTLFMLGKEMGESIKKEYNLGDSVIDMALLMLAHELRWGLKANISKLGEKRSVLRIEYCPFASKYGGPFSSPEDCLLWRHYALGLASGVGSKIKFGEARKKLTKGDEYCEYVFEVEE